MLVIALLAGSLTSKQMCKLEAVDLLHGEKVFLVPLLLLFGLGGDGFKVLVFPRSTGGAKNAFANFRIDQLLN